LPLAAKIVEVGGMKLLDGGISDSIPLKFFEGLGYDRNVVILTQPKGYVKEPTSGMPIMRAVLRKYPNMIKALENRHIMYNDTIRYICEKEEKGEIFVIRPGDTLPIKRTEHTPDKLKAVYDIGRKTMLNHLNELKKFLS